MQIFDSFDQGDIITLIAVLIRREDYQEFKKADRKSSKNIFWGLVAFLLAVELLVVAAYFDRKEK